MPTITYADYHQRNACSLSTCFGSPVCKNSACRESYGTGVEMQPPALTLQAASASLGNFAELDLLLHLKAVCEYLDVD